MTFNKGTQNSRIYGLKRFLVLFIFPEDLYVQKIYTLIYKLKNILTMRAHTFINMFCYFHEKENNRCVVKSKRGVYDYNVLSMKVKVKKRKSKY